eukprot:Platyproteum_vivax@DN6744_c0_g1_i1.p1
MTSHSPSKALSDPTDSSKTLQFFTSENTNQVEVSDKTVQYLEHLLSTSFVRLAKEPAALAAEDEKIKFEMEKLAVNNYGAFIQNARVISSIRTDVETIRGQLQDMRLKLPPLTEKLDQFQNQLDGLNKESEKLEMISKNHTSLLEVLEIPQVLDACIRNSLYEESFDLMNAFNTAFNYETTKQIPLVTVLCAQVDEQQQALHSVFLQQLLCQTTLPNIVRCIGYIRRMGWYSEEELRELFLECRNGFLEESKKQNEEIAGKDFSSLLLAYLHLLHSHVPQIISQYTTLFEQTDQHLAKWLSNQAYQLLQQLRAYLQLPVW